MGLEIVKVTENDSGILKNLMSLYLHDMSEFADFLKLNPDGSYKYQNLHFYWEKDELSAFFIKVDSETAGFILSNRPPFVPGDCEISIQEFFILKKFRGKGFGMKAAAEFFKRFPGKYFIAQLRGNKPAIEFWRTVYKRIGVDCEESEEVDSGIEILTQRFAI
jgi:predicted acetyltransferase